jgi:hypothetical protein
MARCTGCSVPSAAATSSTVNSALPSSVGRNWMQALTGRSCRKRIGRVFIVCVFGGIVA